MSDSGNTFKAFAVSAWSLTQVSARINQIITSPGVSSSRHVSQAERPVAWLGRELDGDNGIGFELLKHLRSRDDVNVVCVVSRENKTGSIHLEKKRFEFPSHAATAAIDSEE